MDGCVCVRRDGCAGVRFGSCRRGNRLVFRSFERCWTDHRGGGWWGNGDSGLGRRCHDGTRRRTSDHSFRWRRRSDRRSRSGYDAGCGPGLRHNFARRRLGWNHLNDWFFLRGGRGHRGRNFCRSHWNGSAHSLLGLLLAGQNGFERISGFGDARKINLRAHLRLSSCVA